MKLISYQRLTKYILFISVFYESATQNFIYSSILSCKKGFKNQGLNRQYIFYIRGD